MRPCLVVHSSEGSVKPWEVSDDTPDRNERARKAYSALLTVTAATPDNTEYRTFSEEVMRMAGDNKSVSTFVTAFYDAVLLYSLALNETLRAGGSETDGRAITQRMWNRTFRGTAVLHWGVGTTFRYHCASHRSLPASVSFL